MMKRNVVDPAVDAYLEVSNDFLPPEKIMRHSLNPDGHLFCHSSTPLFSGDRKALLLPHL